MVDQGTTSYAISFREVLERPATTVRPQFWRGTTLSVPPGIDYDVIAKLGTSPNAVRRHTLLPDGAYRLDFTNSSNLPLSALKEPGGTLVIALSLRYQL